MSDDWVEPDWCMMIAASADECGQDCSTCLVDYLECEVGMGDDPVVRDLLHAMVALDAPAFPASYGWGKPLEPGEEPF